MVQPKIYSAALTRNKDVTMEGVYFKHVYATPYPISTKEEHDKFVEEHTKHYIITHGFSDWGLPRTPEFYEIDPKTLKEVKQNEQGQTDIHQGQ